MKQITAILFCVMLLFNWAGYRFFFRCAEHSAGKALEAELDNNQYDESALLSVKIPSLYLSAYTHIGQFERVDGQVEIKGMMYKYVKKRLFNDSVEFLCIPDQAAMKLQDVNNDFFKKVNDLQQMGQSKKSGSHTGSAFNNFSTNEYISNDPFILNKPVFTIAANIFHYNAAVYPAFFFAIDHPPEMIS